MWKNRVGYQGTCRYIHPGQVPEEMRGTDESFTSQRWPRYCNPTNWHEDTRDNSARLPHPHHSVQKCWNQTQSPSPHLPALTRNRGIPWHHVRLACFCNNFTSLTLSLTHDHREPMITWLYSKYPFSITRNNSGRTLFWVITRPLNEDSYFNEKSTFSSDYTYGSRHWAVKCKHLQGGGTSQQHLHTEVVSKTFTWKPRLNLVHFEVSPKDEAQATHLSSMWDSNEHSNYKEKARGSLGKRQRN